MVLSRFRQDYEKAGKREKPEDIVLKLRQVGVLQGQGRSTAEAHAAAFLNAVQGALRPAGRNGFALANLFSGSRY
jgi:hypothetical protein